MAKAKYSMDLDWKGFNVDLNSVEAWMKENAGSDYCGSSGDSKFHLHWNEEPSQDIKDFAKAYWDDLSEESPEASAYKPEADRKADVAAKKASGKAKLLALGLSEDEVAAILG